MRPVFRPRLPEEPVSRLAIWSRWMAIFSIAVLLLALIIVRSGFLENLPSLVTLAAALGLALVAVVLAISAFVVIWNNGNRGLGLAVTALFIGLVMLAYPGYLTVLYFRLPAISDVTTDPMDPPRFDAVARLRPRDANSITYPGIKMAELQRAAYPSVEPLMLSASPQEVYEVVLAIINKRKWRVVDARAPQGGRREGRIEAVARTLIMGFRDDVAIRIRPGNDEVRVDFRSASRYGLHDFGANASRIIRLAEDIDDAFDTDNPRRLLAAKPVKTGINLKGPQKK